MIKQLIHKSFSITLAIIVLFSTVSFTIEKHFCGDVLVDVAIFAEAQKCAMEALEIELETITKKSCCKDVVDVILGQDELNVTSFDDLEIDQQTFLATFVYSYSCLFDDASNNLNSYKNYRPPLLVYDIQVLDQVFLI